MFTSFSLCILFPLKKAQEKNFIFRPSLTKNENVLEDYEQTRRSQSAPSRKICAGENADGYETHFK